MRKVQASFLTFCLVLLCAGCAPKNIELTTMSNGAALEPDLIVSLNNLCNAVYMSSAKKVAVCFIDGKTDWAPHMKRVAYNKPEQRPHRRLELLEIVVKPDGARTAKSKYHVWNSVYQRLYYVDFTFKKVEEKWLVVDWKQSKEPII